MEVGVKFIKTTTDKLNSIPIVNGQVIALSDKPGLYYDMGNVRHPALKLESFKGADESNPGTTGLVPSPAIGDQNKFLQGDGSWAEVDLQEYAKTEEVKDLLSLGVVTASLKDENGDALLDSDNNPILSTFYFGDNSPGINTIKNHIQEQDSIISEQKSLISELENQIHTVKSELQNQINAIQGALSHALMDNSYVNI